MSTDWSTVARYFEADAVAHLATLQKDGSPHVVPLWVDRHGESNLAFFTINGSRKDRNVARDPRVAVSITAPDNPYDMATVRGEVIERVDGDRGWEIIDRLSQKYEGQPYDRSIDVVAFIVRPTTSWANDFSDE